MSILALDIGGANLKAADGLGWARSVPFALWREPQNLSAALDSLVASAPPATRLGVTMTGELCDSFRTKREGVLHILDAAEQAAAGHAVDVYLANGRLVPSEEARAMPLLAAASNWHALAKLACRYNAGRPGLLIDVGSTTTDIIPLVNGVVAANGCTDTERLLAGDLVYSGIGRTPICAIVDELPYRGRNCPVAAEWFATTADAYVVVGVLQERDDDLLTADGRPRTREYSAERLARMIAADRAAFDEVDACAAAEAIRGAQLAKLRFGLEQVVAKMEVPPVYCVTSGSGEFLATALAEATWGVEEIVSLTKALGPEASTCAPAHAVAVLMREAS
jgi:probable H4MPT-linked C1 transfer pathway protein